MPRKACSTSINKSPRILNDESRAKIVADIDFSPQNGITTSKKAIKTRFTEEAIHQANISEDVKEVAKSKSKFCKDHKISRKQTGTGKTVGKNKITSLEDTVLTEKERQELIACIMRAWHDIEKYKVPRERVVSADQLLTEKELRDGVTYCRRGEGSTMTCGWYKSGATFTLYSEVLVMVNLIH